jgi:hypothetical protein
MVAGQRLLLAGELLLHGQLGLRLLQLAAPRGVGAELGDLGTKVGDHLDQRHRDVGIFVPDPQQLLVALRRFVPIVQAVIAAAASACAVAPALRRVPVKGRLRLVRPDDVELALRRRPSGVVGTDRVLRLRPSRPLGLEGGAELGWGAGPDVVVSFIAPGWRPRRKRRRCVRAEIPPVGRLRSIPERAVAIVAGAARG